MNMSMGIDPQFFRELAEKVPEDICQKALCAYDAENGF
jgi:hypothetical protein